jgi:GTPase Era involved in 16S rRNA processing
MTANVEQLVREAMEITGAEEPSLLERDAPVLASDVLAEDGPFYLVGLIGGKEVGKSALVNALAGRTITATSAHGAGTEDVIAYAHRSQEQDLRDMLERLVPGQYRIVTHDVSALKRQVLLDLPDIDSHFTSHVQVTRTMLRHMLYPVWMVSVEKYADLQPQQMLARVAEGNAPGNFIFCLNKVDQLSRENGAAAELREDYAQRLGRTLNLPQPPRVYMISAMRPDDLDLPELRAALSREKSAQTVTASRQLAAQRQDRSLLAWLERQQLAARAARLGELEEQVRDLAAERIGQPLLDRVIPRLLDDPETRGALAEEILAERVARWPVVRLVHTLLSPVFMLLRGATARNAAPLQTAEGLVEIVLRESGYSAPDLVQTTFAQLRQTRPEMAELYAHQKLWEQMHADLAAAELRRTLADTVEGQREAARAELIKSDWIGAPLRWLLTIGAVIWFPFAQPILEKVLAVAHPASWGWTEALQMTVAVLGVNYLLKSVGFLAIYVTVLWLALRWSTQRKVARVMRRMQETEGADASLSPFSQTLEWLDALTTPVRQMRERTESLARRAEAARKSLTKAA